MLNASVKLDNKSNATDASNASKLLSGNVLSINDIESKSGLSYGSVRVTPFVSFPNSPDTARLNLNGSKTIGSIKSRLIALVMTNTKISTLTAPTSTKMDAL